MLEKAGIRPGTQVQIDVRGNDSTFGEVAQAVAAYLQGVGCARDHQAVRGPRC